MLRIQQDDCNLWSAVHSPNCPKWPLLHFLYYRAITRRVRDGSEFPESKAHINHLEWIHCLAMRKVRGPPRAL